MERGKIVEIGVPHELLCNEDSAFRKLVSETGEKFASHLKEAARIAYERKQQNRDSIFQDDEESLKYLMWRDFVKSEVELN